MAECMKQDLENVAANLKMVRPTLREGSIGNTCSKKRHLWRFGRLSWISLILFAATCGDYIIGVILTKEEYTKL